jgi:16S rRNA (guanine966-N2)-methyltransferase
LRIIAGKYKSRKLSLPKSSKNGKAGLPLRPTSDRARETLFDILNNIIDFDGISCLDLFAGTGALGLEALSRGASEASFVDKSETNIASINKTAEELGCAEKVTVVENDAIQYVNSNGLQFDLVFADPPYDYEKYRELVDEVLKTRPQLFVLETYIDNRDVYTVKNYENEVRTVGTAKFNIFVAK